MSSGTRTISTPLGMLKVDVLALGMLSCIRRAFDFMKRHYGGAPTLATHPRRGPGRLPHAPARRFGRRLPGREPRADDHAAAAQARRNSTTSSSRWRSSAPARSRATWCIPISAAGRGSRRCTILRPRPSMVPRTSSNGSSSRTLGVPLFQEQAMKIAMVAAKFTAAEADKLRRAMATFKRVGTIGTFQAKMIEGMVARGYERDFAERCFHQIEGFGEYGFPESHAASFALLVYASAWLKCHYPDVFCAALLNAQPMGFYAPAQIVRDAERHGVAVRAVDVNSSDWDCTLEEEARVPPPQSGGGGPCEAWWRGQATDGVLRFAPSTGFAGPPPPLCGGGSPSRPPPLHPRRDAPRHPLHPCRPPRPPPDQGLLRGRRREAHGGARAGLRFGPRPLAPLRPDARRDRAARRCRCLPLARARSPRGAMGGARARRRQGTRPPAAFRYARIRRYPPRARCRPAADAARRACGQRLPLPQPLAEGPPGFLHPADAHRAGHHCERGAPRPPKRRGGPEVRPGRINNERPPRHASPAWSSSASARARRAASSS